MTEARARPPAARPLLGTPARVAVLLGGSTAVYAISLAAIAGWQSDADAALAAARPPALDQVAAGTRRVTDDIEARIGAAEAELRDLADAYGGVGTDVEALADRLERLAALVAEVEGSAASLPARIRLPSVSIRDAPAPGDSSRPPRTSGRSGASGG